MGRSSAVLLAMFVACSPSAPPNGDAPSMSMGSGSASTNDGAQSGSRLKLTYYAFTDGTTQWFGLYDSERKENCNPFDGTWPDGNTYCVPEWSGSIVYSDAMCTMAEDDEFVGSTCASSVQRYVLDENYDSCSEQYLPTHLYLKGSATNATQYYDKNSDGTCGGPYTVDTGFEVVYAVTSEVDTSQLVPLALSAPMGDTIGERSWTSPDGAALPTLLHDSTTNTDCTPQYYGDSATTAACAPTDAFDAYLDRDVTCTQPTLDIASTCAPPPYAYTYPSGTSCPEDLASYHGVGTKMSTPTAVYEPFGSLCLMDSVDTTESYYSLGSNVSLAQLQRTPDTLASHRIQLIHYGDGGTLHYRDPTYLYDSQEMAVCVPEQLSDNSIRCVPDSGIQVTTGFFFSDSACKTALDVVDLYTGPTTCAAVTLPQYVRKYLATTGCTESFELHQPTTELGTLYYENGSACTKYAPSEEVIYGVGPVISTSNFVTAAITTDN